MKTTKIITSISFVCIAILAIMGSCTKPKDFAANDIKWPVPVIDSVSPKQAPVQSNIKIYGKGLSLAQYVYLSGIQCPIVGDTADNVLTITIPRKFTIGTVMVTNKYDRSTTSASTVAPIYPSITINTWASQLESRGNLTITGDNVDLITGLIITDVTNNNTISNVTYGSSGGPTNIVKISTGTADLRPGEQIMVQAISNYSTISGSSSPSIEVIKPVKYFDPCGSLLLFNFENGVDPMVSADAGCSHGINLSGIQKGRGQNYLTIRENGVTDAWGLLIYDWKYNGTISLGDTFHNPCITFLANTNGKHGNFQPKFTQGGVDYYGNFTAVNTGITADDYDLATSGWEWISVPISSFGLSGFDPKQPFTLEFGCKLGNGNVGGNTSYELNIDQMMITDGPQRIAYTAWNFEDGIDPWVSSGSGASHGINLSGVPSIMGNNYYSVMKSGAGTWDGTGSIEKDVTWDLSTLNSACFNFWLNTHGTYGYFQLFLTQGGVEYRNDFQYTMHTNGWELQTIRLSTAPNWANVGFDPKGTVSHIKLWFSTGNGSGTTPFSYETNLDEVTISDNPMF
jgi:hypothetical protein